MPEELQADPAPPPMAPVRVLFACLLLASAVATGKAAGVCRHLLYETLALEAGRLDRQDD